MIKQFLFWLCNQNNWKQGLEEIAVYHKTWKQLKCLTTDKWISKIWYIQTMGQSSALKRRKFWYMVQHMSIWTLRTFQFSRSFVSNSLPPHEPQHARPPCPSPTPGVYPNPCPLSQWCHPTISSSIVPFSSSQSFLASGSIQMGQLFTSGGQSIGVSASILVLPMNTQDWSPLGWTGWISLQSKGLSRVFSNTPVQKHQFFSAQLSL